MKHDLRWTDGTKLRNQRVISAFLRGVLVERRATPGGVARWIARCEHIGCDQTYDFTEISSRQTKEARCGFHVSRKGVRGGRLFFGEVEVIGPSLRKAFEEKRIVSVTKTNAGWYRWIVQCSAEQCRNNMILKSSSKSSFRFQLCQQCNAKRMKQDASADPAASLRKNRRLVWIDGSWIIGQRTIRAFLDGKLVAKDGVFWRAKCEHPGCVETYNFSTANAPQAKQKRCPLHTEKASRPHKPRKRYKIAGRYTTNTELAAFEHRLQWKLQGSTGRYRAAIRCEQGSCRSQAWFRPGKRLFFCQDHANKKRSLRPFEAIYNLFCIAQVSRNKKRKSPLRVLISYAEFATFCQQNPLCFFCEKDINRLPFVPKKALAGGNRTNVRAAYIDRIDPAKHYSLDNIVSACGPCNMTKNIFVSHNEMILIAKLRTGRFADASEQIARKKEEFLRWGKEVASHSSYWAGARGPRRPKK